MEHIRPHHVDRVIDNCLAACQHVFFQISTVDDICGVLIGHKLHLSVHPYKWWLQKFKEKDCVIHWSQETDNTCLFYVSNWLSGTDVVDAGVVNTENEQIKKNVAHNIKQRFFAGRTSSN
jgi:hypothetical protein